MSAAGAVRFARTANVPVPQPISQRGLFVTERPRRVCSGKGEVRDGTAKDRRVERTQEQLRGALVALIRERGFEPLTVQDIIDRANVGRATFYAHFDNKEDLLTSGFDHLRESLRAVQREALDRTGAVDERVLAFTYEVFAHTDAHRDLFRMMIGKRSGAAVRRILHKLLLDLVRRDVPAISGRTRADVPHEALVRFMTGALFGLLMWWVEGRRRPMAVEEVSALFRQFALPVLHAARHAAD